MSLPLHLQRAEKEYQPRDQGLLQSLGEIERYQYISKTPPPQNINEPKSKQVNFVNQQHHSGKQAASQNHLYFTLVQASEKSQQMHNQVA